MSDLVAPLVESGYVFVIGSEMRDHLLVSGPLDDWSAFAASWDDLHLDHFMADGGRYRRRRHALYRADPAISRKPHGPHWQSHDYNPLNGGIERWFEPVASDFQSLATILAWCCETFGALAPATSFGSRRVAAQPRSRRPRAYIAMVSTTCSCC